MAKAGVGSKTKILHPQILINQLSKVPLAGLEGLPASENKPILHQAVQLKQTSITKGNLTLTKLVYMGFDVNVLDENGETAISHFFKTSLRFIDFKINLFFGRDLYRLKTMLCNFHFV